MTAPSTRSLSAPRKCGIAASIVLVSLPPKPARRRQRQELRRAGLRNRLDLEDRRSESEARLAAVAAFADRPAHGRRSCSSTSAAISEIVLAQIIDGRQPVCASQAQGLDIRYPSALLPCAERTAACG